MRAGRLRHRIHLQWPVKGQDETSGDSTLTWATATLEDGTELDNVPAEVLTGPGREQKAAGATHAETAARINLRWFSGLSPEWRILWDGYFDSNGDYDGKIYNITSIETDATARREYWLTCSEGLSDGR